MNNAKFIENCKKLVLAYANAHPDKTDNVSITLDDVYVVWLCKTLQNNKALLSTTLTDGMYYEVTYDGDKKAMYFDAYRKIGNMSFHVDEFSEVEL